MKPIRTLMIALFLLALLAACAAPGGDEPAAGEDTIVDYESLVAALRAAGAVVEPETGFEQPFFEPMAQVVAVDGQQLQIIEFPTAEAALAAARTVSEDGSSVGTTMLTWQDTPHFYRVDRMIALYVGSDATVLELLQQVLGEPFAGG